MAGFEPQDKTDVVTGRRDEEQGARDPLPRLTNRVFLDLALWMAGFGLGIGILFPFFVTTVGVPSSYVITGRFFVLSITAGLIVGATNHWLSRIVVRSRLRFMGSKMYRVEEALRRGGFDEATCTPEKCFIPVDSNDELGEVAASFNHLIEALATSHRQTQITRRFAATMASHIELGPLSEAALTELEQAGTHAASALFATSDAAGPALVASRGVVEPGRLARGELVQQAYRSLTTRVIELPNNLTLDEEILAFRARCVVVHPLHVGKAPIGVLVVASAEVIDETEIQLVQQLLSSLAVALTNALAHERLQRVAAIDELTGLYNRRLGLERLREELTNSARSGEALGLALFDLDHFKSINDTHGHQVGDRVLRAVANAVSSVLRESDTLIRYGGEEFVALLPAADEGALVELSERIRVAVESCSLTDGPLDVRVTASVGAACYAGSGPIDAEQLIDQADAAMYSAKQAGRNTLALASR